MEAASARIVKAYKGASLVVVRNELQREAAINVGVDEDRVRVIPNWVSGKHLAGANRQESFLFVGRLVREKGVDVLIEAAASAGVRVKIIGDGPVRGELEAQVRERSAPVEMLGWLPHDQVVDSLAKSAGLIVPSVWPEVFPLVICEAFATGTAVVGTAVGGVEDLLSEGRGFLCQPGDVNGLAEILRRISAQPEEAAERAREARRFASDMLSHEAWVNHYESAYEAIGASL
jgi:glycosyltransferase involved in cell wall biosynthesis